MLELLEKLKEGVLDILLPKFCVGCGREGIYICKDCEIFLSEVPPSKEVIAVWEYEGLMEKLIQKIKFDGCYHIIDELIDKAMTKIELNLPEDIVITYVPMYKKKEKYRGFNQAGLIAKKLGQLLNRVKQQPVEVLPLLKKVKDNRSQVGLGPKEREENVKDVFGISENPEFFERFTLKGSDTSQKIQYPRLTNVLLVDDVYTTGATANECKKVLKKSGIKNVWVFTLARKLRI